MKYYCQSIIAKALVVITAVVLSSLVIKKFANSPNFSKDDNYSSLPTVNLKIEPHPLFVTINNNFHVYSAFWETRYYENYVRLLGFIRINKGTIVPQSGNKVTESALNLKCFLWYRGKKSPIEGKLSADGIIEGTYKVLLSFFKCVSTGDKSEVPYAVSLIPKAFAFNGSSKENYRLSHSYYPHKLIPVEHFEPTPPHDFTTVCVKELFGPFDDKLGLIQFIIYYKYVLKVDRFIFYNLAVTIEISTLIAQLQEMGINISFFNWNVPTGPHLEAQDYGALTSYSDCIHRSMNGFAVIVDIDEFIVPTKGNRTIPQIYRNALKLTRGQTGDAVIVLNRFFCKTAPSSVESVPPILSLTTGEMKLRPVGDRSKIIVYTNTISKVGHHTVFGFTNKKFRNVACPGSVASLHHYRVCDNLTYGKKFNTINTMNKWRSLVLESDIWILYQKGEL